MWSYKCYWDAATRWAQLLQVALSWVVCLHSLLAVSSTYARHLACLHELEWYGDIRPVKNEVFWCRPFYLVLIQISEWGVATLLVMLLLFLRFFNRYLNHSQVPRGALISKEFILRSIGQYVEDVKPLVLRTGECDLTFFIESDEVCFLNFFVGTESVTVLLS